MKINIFFEKLKTRCTRLFTKYNWNLLVELVRAEFKASDRNSMLGILWSFLGPISLFLVMYFIFRARFGQGITAYPLYLLIGIISVSFFVTTNTYMIRIFFTHREIVINSTVPRETIILSDLFIHAYKFLIELALCWVISIFYGFFTWKGFFISLPLLLAYFALVLGLGLLLSLFYCFARDIGHIWTLASRLFFFASPIFYSLDKISPFARKLIYWGNPLTPFLISFQQVFMGIINLPNYVYSLLLGYGYFILGYYVFIILENTAIERA